MSHSSPLQPAFPPPQEPAVNPAWSDRFAFDVALRLEGSGETINEILDRYGKTTDDLTRISADKLFQKRVREYREDIRLNGTTFKTKARAQAEALLTTSWNLIHAPEVLPSVKADLIKSTVKWAGLEPTKDDAPMGGVTGGVTININFDGQDEPVPVKVTPVVEHEENV